MATESIPDHLIKYDYDFNIQGYLESKDCFLATYDFDGVPASTIIRFYCLRYNVNAKWIINRMQTEFCLLTGHVEGKFWVYPYPHKPKPMQYFLAEICGYGLDHRFKKWRDNLGFVNQVRLCAKSTRETYNEYGWSDYVLFIYDGKHGGMQEFVKSWKMLWPSDFK